MTSRTTFMYVIIVFPILADKTTMITISDEVILKFVLRMDIIVTEDLSNSTQYSIVKDKAESSVSSIYCLLLLVSFIRLSKQQQSCNRYLQDTNILVHFAVD